MVAAENQSVECIDALLKNPQTECDACNHGGATALMYATKNGCPRSLQLFRFCDPNVVDNMGRTALELAMGHKNISAVEYLVRRDDLSLKKAFDTALNRRDLEVANSIISRKDFDPNANSSLHSALEHDERLVGLLLSRRDTDPNMISSNKAPLHLAIEKNSIESLRLLLAREDVDPNIVVNRLGTPLGAAVYCGNKQAMELLLTREDIDINRGTWKPLITAMFYNEHELVSLLLGDHRIAVHLQDGFGRTALTESAGKGDVKVLRQLFAKDSTLDLNHRAPDGNTALLLAAESGCEPTVQYLLDMGADVNAQNDFDQAPLHAAACYGHEGVMRLLIDYGANPDLEDENGDTPYIAAISAIEELRNTCGVNSWNARMGPLWR